MTLEHRLAIEQAYKQIETGQIPLAEDRCRELLAKNKDDIEAIHLMAVIAHSTSRNEQAATLLKQCINRFPKYPVYHADLARVWMVQGRYDDAIARYEKAIKLKPDYIEAIVGKADALEKKGQKDAARKFLAPYIANGVNDDGLAVIVMRLMEEEGQREEAVALAERMLAKPERDRVARRMLNLQAGRMYDRVGKYAEAFAAYTRANGSGAAKFDAPDYIASTDRLMGIFSAENLAVLPRADDRSELPVFIACMPRSGSTLVEQILHAHPKAFGAGEIDDLDSLVRNLQERIESFQQYPACVADLKPDRLNEFSQKYLAQLRKLGGGAIRVANKHLINYRHLGLISMLFPGARIIHIKRNRIDNCLACFMAALAPGQFPWIADLRYTGIAWREYERLMAHWRETLTLPMLEVTYENLVENTDAEIRRIIDFCGLEWDDKCLRYWEVDRKVLTLSYDQVRKPIFKTAVMRYKRYEEFLGPLKEALGEEVV